MCLIVRTRGLFEINEGIGGSMCFLSVHSLSLSPHQLRFACPHMRTGCRLSGKTCRFTFMSLWMGGGTTAGHSYGARATCAWSGLVDMDACDCPYLRVVHRSGRLVEEQISCVYCLSLTVFIGVAHCAKRYHYVSRAVFTTRAFEKFCVAIFGRREAGCNVFVLGCRAGGWVAWAGERLLQETEVNCVDFRSILVFALSCSLFVLPLVLLCCFSSRARCAG